MKNIFKKLDHPLIMALLFFQVIPWILFIFFPIGLFLYGMFLAYLALGSAFSGKTSHSCDRDTDASDK